ncbi:hypothetical protein TrLO_g7959 [Triparma laevis f. longispina]|uniref:Uncharacterized protein n=1 Tax=Triparma laevis f. longispina TaxID=1714387 RepID=A0A9W7KVT1_9STRA|nr:hypothetical protein TrLO_g7959 [Triparma laevis f. longispina]
MGCTNSKEGQLSGVYCHPNKFPFGPNGFDSFAGGNAQVGDLIILFGLHNKPYMNYLIGSIVSMPSLQTNNRYLIDIQFDKYNQILRNFDSTLRQQIVENLLGIQTTNLNYHWPLQAGDRARTHSLSTTSMNHKVGTVLQIQNDRSAVQLDGQARVASFKHTNLYAIRETHSDIPIATATAVAAESPVGSAFATGGVNDDDEIFITVATPV